MSNSMNHQITELELRLRLRREKLTLYHKPFQTMFIFLLASYSYFKILLRYIFLHPVVIYFLAPIVFIWFVSEFFPGPYTAIINKFEFYIEFIVWWVGLGILSSIGFGSGLQTGVLFLFPHILKVCLAAQTCKTLDFESDTNMWFRNPPDLFICPPLNKNSNPVTFYGTWLKIFHICFLQASGTAIGEIPPYWITRAARLAGSETGSITATDLPEELDINNSTSFFNKAKLWMIRMLKTYGFYGVLFMASFPNIAFDICGIYCGHYLMPFWTFFGATFVGKAVVRNLYQSVIYVALCSESYLETMIQILQYITPDSLNCDKIIREILVEGRASFHKEINNNINHTPGTKRQDDLKTKSDGKAYAIMFMFWWQVFMMFILVSFLLSCVSQFAQYHQMTIDNEEVNKFRQKLGCQHPPIAAVGNSNLSTPTTTTNITQREITSNTAGSPPLNSNSRSGVIRHHIYSSPLPTTHSSANSLNSMSTSTILSADLPSKRE